MEAVLNVKFVGQEKAQAALEALTKAAQDCQQALRELGLSLLEDDEVI